MLGRPIRYPNSRCRRILVAHADETAVERLREIVVEHKQTKLSKAAVYRAAVQLISQLAEARPDDVARELLRLDDPTKYAIQEGKVT